MNPSTVVAELAGLRIEKLVTAGTFCLDGGTWEVENNVWILGSDHDVVIIDAAHDADVMSGSRNTCSDGCDLHPRAQRSRQRC